MRHEMLTQCAPFCIGVMAKKGTLSQHFVTHVVPPLALSYESRYRAFQVACNWAMSCRSSHVIKLKLSSQLFGHVTASASCKQPEKHGMHRDDSDL